MRLKLRPQARSEGAEEWPQAIYLRFCGAASGIRTPDLRITSPSPSAAEQARPSGLSLKPRCWSRGVDGCSWVSGDTSGTPSDPWDTAFNVVRLKTQAVNGYGFLHSLSSPDIVG
jgi:hypothetical protein